MDEYEGYEDWLDSIELTLPLPQEDSDGENQTDSADTAKTG